MLQNPKPKTARAARVLSHREPQSTENSKTTLFLRSAKCSEITQLVIKDLHALKRPLAQRFTKKNSIHPFEDASSLEFFAEKNDTSLLVLGAHSKKRPHALTFVRCFNSKALDMLELLIEPETMRTLSQFKNDRKPGVGLKPLISFVGTPFESPTTTKFTLAKSLLLDFLKGPDVPSVDVEGLQYMICISAADEVEGQPPPVISMRCYLMKTKRSGQKLPKVEVEEMGPRVDFRVGRSRNADEGMWKEAMKRPRGIEQKAKKNIETDFIGDKVGRIHLGKQNLDDLQTRKMKGLKRKQSDASDGLEEEDVIMDDDEDEEDVKRRRVSS
ncbi:MAG: rRNA-binding ribosome biosynthesis protein rpf2 [Chrysothrix sp. TS-e1954]|nr:MAG: rRNA-binding ribosome biosynthesis protein rpf2 [Chrysothrix sp. TS-e1954]